MIDTISLKHTVRGLTEQKLERLGAVSKVSGKNPKWILNCPYGSPKPRITVVRSPDAVFHLYVEHSLPRLVYGYNWRLLTEEEDLRKAVERMCSFVEERVGVEFDSQTAVIRKIHLARDYFVGDAANTAVFALFEKRPRHFSDSVIKSERTGVNTLYFNYASKKRNCVICIYPKQAEVIAKKGSIEAVQATEGILRIEIRGNSRMGISSLCKRFDLKSEREILSKHMNDRIFNWIEEDLDFPQSIANEKSPLAKLLDHYSERKAQRLYGFFEMRRLKGDAFMQKSDAERRNFNASRRECEKAGVWPDRRQTQE